MTENAADRPDRPADYEATIELVVAAQQGNRNALERLFERYLPRVRRIVALRTGRRLGQLLEIEDLVQEALMKVFRGLDRFEQRSEGSLRNWLANCVQCEIVDQVRRVEAKKRGSGKVLRFGDCSSGMLVSSIFMGDEASPSSVAHTRDLEERVELALLDMPKHLREVVILRYLCELPYSEIAAELGIGQETTARKACSRAAQELRKKMAALSS